MHNFKHSRDEFLQDFRLLGDDFVCNLLRQGQYPLHPIAKTQGHLVILVLFLQQLKPSRVTSKSDVQAESTNLKRDAGNTENSLRNWVQLIGVNILLLLCEYGTTNLCEDSSIFNYPVHGLFTRSAHQWGIFL